ncbi:SFB3 [Sanghuangporus sanghuang]
MFAHGAHISQPPHTSGKAYQGLRTRIDPEQIPSPVDVAEYDAEIWEGKSYMTLPGDHVPLSTTDFVSIDQGNSSPRFVRATTWHMPHSAALADACKIPLATIIQPFAELITGEDEIPVVDCGESGPARCAECRGYINPWCTWVSGGSRWRCNLCGHLTDVLPEYFCNLDANQMRLDHLQRPELNKGTIDFAVGPEYYAPQPTPRIVPSFWSPEASPAPNSSRTPEPMRVLFAIDVSREAVQNGMVRAACQAIIGVLYGSETDDGTRLEPCFPAECLAGVVTFDTTVHFYDLSNFRDSASMLVVPDIEEEMYCPLQDAEIFVEPQAARNVIEGLLTSLPNRFENESVHLCALGAAMRGCLAALSRRGGQAILFQSSMCSVGPGVSEARLDESKLYDTDKEKQLFTPRDPMWTDLAEELAEAGIGVSMLVGTGPISFVDFASIGVICALSGGDVRLFPRFDLQRDSPIVRSHVGRILSRETGHSCQARVRVSRGLKTRAFYGALTESSVSPGSLIFGVMHADSAFAVELSHSSGRGTPLDSREYAHLQCAVLYTTRQGSRRVRVLNVAFQVAGMAGNVFRYADSDATICFLAKEAMATLSSESLSTIRDTLTEKCSNILLAYRRNCAAATSPSQLILPEAFKLLPLYLLALQKNRSLRAHNVPADIRNYHAQRLLTMPVRKMLYHLYPRFLALHDLTDDIALPPGYADGNAASGSRPIPTNRLQLPSLMRDTFMAMRADGIYLIDNEEVMVLWIGSNVSPEVLADLFGVNTPHGVDPTLTRLPVLPTRLSSQVRNIIAHRIAERSGVLSRLMVARQSLDAAELEFSDMLVEDTNCGAMSYIDYLCVVHKQINNALTNNTTIEHSTSYGLRGTPW